MAAADRIAFVCPRFAEGGTVGGAETLMRRLAERALVAGRRATFLTTCASDHFTWANDRPAGVRRFGDLETHFFPVDEDRDIPAFLDVQTRICNGGHVSPDDEMLWLRNNVNSSALYEHLRSHGDDYDRIVMGPYLFGLVYFASLVHPEKTILVPCLHDEPFAYLSHFGDMFRGVAGCMFNSGAERDLAGRLYNLPTARDHVVGMGLDDFTVDRDACARKHGLTGPYVVYCGRREGLKGTPLLCDYMHAFRERSGLDIPLVLTGSGEVPLPPEQARHTVDLGFVDEREKHEAMAGAVAFCHPSVHESFSIVLLEAWLAGTPGLVHGKSEVMRAHCRASHGGLWFHTYPEFEESLQRLIDQPALRDAMGAAGRAYVRREYSWEAVEVKLLAALDAMG